MSIEDKIRRKERKSILLCCMNYGIFNKFDKKEKIQIVNDIERSILNASVDKATERNIKTFWESEPFIEQYSVIGNMIKTNIDPKSSVNMNKDNKTKYFLIRNICNYLLINELKRTKNRINIILKNTKKIINNPKIKVFMDDFLVNKILEDVPKIDISKLGYMSSIELNPNINKLYILELKDRSNESYDEKYSTMYTCPQCSAKKSHAKEIQACSLDEGGTLFITCKQCSYTWTQYS